MAKPVWTSWNIFWGCSRWCRTRNFNASKLDLDLESKMMSSSMYSKILMLTINYSDWDQRILVLTPPNLLSLKWYKICLDRRLKLTVIIVMTIKCKACKLSLLPHIANSKFQFLHFTLVNIWWVERQLIDSKYNSIIHKMVENKRFKMRWEHPDWFLICFVFGYHQKSVSFLLLFKSFDSLNFGIFGNLISWPWFYFTQETNFEHKDSNTICFSCAAVPKPFFNLVFLSAAWSRILLKPVYFRVMLDGFKRKPFYFLVVARTIVNPLVVSELWIFANHLVDLDNWFT